MFESTCLNFVFGIQGLESVCEFPKLAFILMFVAKLCLQDVSKRANIVSTLNVDIENVGAASCKYKFVDDFCAFVR